MLFLGRHVGFPIALEGALKLKELAYIHAEGFAAGELKHGPIALIEPGLPVFCVVPPRGRDQLHDKMVSAIQEIRARGRAHDRAGRGRRPGHRGVRRHADPAAAGLDAAAAGARPSYRCSCSRASWRPASATTSTSRATWPSPSRSSRPASWRSSASASTWSTSRASRTSLRRTPGLAARLFTAGRGRPAAGLAGRALRRQGGAGQGARRPRRPGLARRRGGLGVVGPAAVRAPRHRRRPPPPSSAPPTSTCRSPTTPASPRPSWSSSPDPRGVAPLGSAHEVRAHRRAGAGGRGGADGHAARGRR